MNACTSIIALALLICACGIGFAQEPTPVKVGGGLVQGTSEDGLTVYRGIPFAAPPVGKLRWRAPQPAAKWSGVLQATKFAPAPIQSGGPSEGTSEDCLYLNVWTPAKSTKERLPVMVWIYGGGFASGATSWYTGEQLAKKGVVFVNIAYRVGVLGFLAHPELSAENAHHASGNYGISDQIAALKWVQKNISAFGGDRKKVTIFGESAGGISVSMLCASPLAKGLFRGAISESGGSFGPTRPTTFPGENMKPLTVAEDEGQKLAQSHGCSSIADMRKLDAKTLSGGGWPIVDGYVIPDDQYKLYDAGKFNDVNVLVGYNSDEGLSFWHDNDPTKFVDYVQRRFGPFADKLLTAYPAGEKTVGKPARDLVRDAAFGWHTWSWARLQSERGKSKVFFYYFDQHPAYAKGSPEEDHGSPHAQEVSYVLKHLNPSDPNTSSSDLAISDAMADYWTNFAKYGDPNGTGLPSWPAFDDSNQSLMYFSQTPHVGPVPSLDSLKVLDSYFAWRRSSEGSSWAK